MTVGRNGLFMRTKVHGSPPKVANQGEVGKIADINDDFNASFAEMQILRRVWRLLRLSRARPYAQNYSE